MDVARNGCMPSAPNTFSFFSSPGPTSMTGYATLPSSRSTLHGDDAVAEPGIQERHDESLPGANRPTADGQYFIAGLKVGDRGWRILRHVADQRTPARLARHKNQGIQQEGQQQVERRGRRR